MSMKVNSQSLSSLAPVREDAKQTTRKTAEQPITTSTIGAAKYLEESRKQTDAAKQKLEALNPKKDETPKTCGQKIKEALASLWAGFVKCICKIFCCKPKVDNTIPTAVLKEKLQAPSADFIAEANVILDQHGDKFSAEDRIYLRALLRSEKDNGAKKTEKEINADFASFVKQLDKVDRALAPTKKEETKPAEEIEMTSLSKTAKGSGQKLGDKEETPVKPEVPSQGPDVFASAKTTRNFADTIGDDQL